jgi:hypothetical protein
MTPWRPGWSRLQSSHAFFPGSRLSNISHPLVPQGLTDCSQGLPPAPPGQEDLGNDPGYGHEIDLYRRQAELQELLGANINPLPGAQIRQVSPRFWLLIRARPTYRA